MSLTNGSRVLAIGIDAAEPTLIEQLMSQNKLPALQALLKHGKWLSVESPANIGSGSVWPTFITGHEPSKHGVYGEWAWHPETMKLSRYSGRDLNPFWSSLIERGVRVGVLDVPFCPFIRFPNGFEICEWGPHDLLECRLQIAPSEAAAIVASQVESHPFLLDRLDTGGPRDYEGLKKLISESLRGIQLRGTLARRLIAQTDPHLTVIVFTEIHHSGHYMWHTIDPEHRIYNSPLFKELNAIQPSLSDIYCEVDRQIGELVKTVGPEATVMVFSLHGMRPTHGVPTFLEPLLREKGLARFAGWSSRSWTERGIELIAATKRRAPQGLKKLYYKTLPPTATLRLARPTMMPVYDWQQTRAFALPADQHGWLHVNLAGREVKGIVPPEQFESTINELEQILMNLTSTDGEPIVREVLRTAKSVDEALRQRLPDLVVHWEDVAFSSPLKISDSKLEVEPAGKKFTGRHKRDGFCILKGTEGLHEGATLRAAEIHRLITKALENGGHVSGN
jgi:predicted AlkP superfamily phosphohydrolase/phosphomutase